MYGRPTDKDTEMALDEVSIEERPLAAPKVTEEVKWLERLSRNSISRRKNFVDQTS